MTEANPYERILGVARPVAYLTGLATVVALLLVAVSGLRDRLVENPGEMRWWGYLVPVLFGLTWLVFYVGTRLNTRRDASGSPPQGVVQPGQRWIIGAGAVLAVLAMVYWVIINGGRRGHGGLDETFPELDDASSAAVPLVAAVCATVWLVWAVAPAAFAYARRRAHPELVDAVVDLGGSNAVRLLYRPTLSLGGKTTWQINGKRKLTLSPGQAIGILAPDGPLTVTDGKRARRAMVVRLDLASGAGTDVVVRRGLAPRVSVKQRDGEVALVVARRPFASLWVGPGGMVLPVWPDGLSHVSVSEREGARLVRPRWWISTPWVPLIAAGVGAAMAAALVWAAVVRPAHGLGDELIAVAALPLILLAFRLDRARRALGWSPWRAPLALLLAALAGGIAWWGAGWMTLAVTGVMGGLIALARVLVSHGISGGAEALGRRIGEAGAFLPTSWFARHWFWARQPDAVAELDATVAEGASRGFVRVVPSTRGLRGDLTVKVSGWSASVADAPVGARLAAGVHRGSVAWGGEVADREVEVRAGHVTPMFVGRVPFGLQFRGLKGRLSVAVGEPFPAALVVDEAPEF